jgi:CheY-like chemotaxis protein
VEAWIVRAQPRAPARILVVDADEVAREVTSSLLREEDYNCVVASTAERAFELAAAAETPIVISTIRGPGQEPLWPLEDGRKRFPDTAVILLVAGGEGMAAVDCLCRGVVDYLARPPKLTDLVRSVERALAKRRIEMARKRYRKKLEEPTHCAICSRHEFPLLKVGGAAPCVCVGCARRIATYILNRAGRAVVWHLEVPRPGRPRVSLSRLVLEEISALVEEPFGEVSPAVIDGPPQVPSPERELGMAFLQLDADRLESLQCAARVLLTDAARESVLSTALRIIFHPRVLRKGGVERLKRLLFQA